MKLCKANYEETKSAMVESIKKFIDYINEYCSEYAWLNDNMEKYAEESKGRVKEFIETWGELFEVYHKEGNFLKLISLKKPYFDVCASVPCKDCKLVEE